MRRDTLNKIVAVCCVIVIATGCKARKMVSAPVTANTPVVLDDSKANTIAAIKSRQLAFKTFSGRANADLNIDKDSRSVTMNIRIERGKQIWVSITAILGLEGARALITPDSIKIVNRIQAVYIKKPFSYIHTYAGKQVNYNTIEAILTGNAGPELLTANADLQKSNNNVELSGKLQELLYKMLFNPDMKLAELNLTNAAQQQTLQVTNSGFVVVDGHTVPSKISIGSSLQEKKISVNLDYSKIEIDRALEYPFNIPETYTPAN